MIEDLVLSSFSSWEIHTWHSHAITGIPCDVPDPNMVHTPFMLCFIDKFYAFILFIFPEEAVDD
tara:strand:- start:58 stop:249 length:192 start_codon:yes stop_codon:yes gene_type:complete